MADDERPTEREWLEGLRYEDKFAPCGCARECGDDGDIDGPGVCKDLPRPLAPSLVKVMLVRRERRDG